METQWALIIFTLFVCLTCGILASMAVMALRGEGRDLQFPSLITAAVSLVVGGLGAFMHLQHWERIFNGFGHITSGITQELIGCVVLGIVMVVWFIALRGEKPVSKALAWVTIVAAILMVVATGHSYYMPARPAWGLALIVFYLANAALLGTIFMWLLGVIKSNKSVEEMGIKYSFITAIVQLVASAIYALSCAMAHITDYGYYADPTQITTAPTHVDSLLNVMVAGDGALMFWCSIICAIVVLVCTIVAKNKVGASKPFMAIGVIAAIVMSLTFRVLFYQLAYSLFLLY